MLKIFIGYDPAEAVAYHVLAHSILTRASKPVEIVPLAKSMLKGIYTRERSPTESTDFSLTRFLVPYLSGYEGTSIFMDCDMLCKTDITTVLDDQWIPHALWVCMHDYIPKSETKFLGHTQTKYKMKNWSSFIVFDNKQHFALTPEYVNTASGLDLHQFKWLPKDLIWGSLDLSWNWLVGEYKHNDDAKILHYTLGGPWHPGQGDCDHSEDWLREYDRLRYPLA